MFSKTPVVLAAGLLSSVWAQNITTSTNGTYTNGTATSTVTVDVYASTTTIQNQCSVCTPGATASSYTVVVGNGVTTTLGGGGAGVGAESTGAPNGGAGSDGAATGGAGVGATSASTSLESCGFSLSVSGGTPLQQISDGQIQASQQLQQIADGQIQAAQYANSSSGLTDTTFTISNGMVYDNVGRICSISGQNQSQFQCNYVPTDGSTTTTFSLINNLLAFDGNTQFYKCLLGADGEGYNIYYELTGNQHTCSPITLVANPAASCVPATTAVPVVSTTTAAPVTTLQPVVVVATPATTVSNDVPVITSSAAATAVFASAGSSTKGSIIGLVAATLFTLFLF